MSENHVLTIKDTLDKEESRNKLTTLLGSEQEVERFVALAVSLSKNMDLISSRDKAVFLQGLSALAELKLMPLANINYGYFIRYKNKDTGAKELSFQLGYRAFVELMGRAGIHVVVQEVKELDVFLVDPANNKVVHEINSFDRGEVKGYYAYCKERGIIELISRKDVEDVRNNSSKAPDSPAWKKYYDEMAKKIVIKRFFKRIGGLQDINHVEVISKAEEMDNEANYTLVKEDQKTQEKRKAMETIDLDKEVPQINGFMGGEKYEND